MYPDCQSQPDATQSAPACTRDSALADTHAWVSQSPTAHQLPSASVLGFPVPSLLAASCLVSVFLESFTGPLKIQSGGPTCVSPRLVLPHLAPSQLPAHLLLRPWEYCKGRGDISDHPHPHPLHGATTAGSQCRQSEGKIESYLRTRQDRWLALPITSGHPNTIACGSWMLYQVLWCG